MSGISWGTVPAGSVLPFHFSSYDGATGASEAISGLAVTDIEVYKGTSVTQRASDAGYALIDTDGIDIDGMVGANGFSIDTGDNTDAGFYTVGSFFTVWVDSISADGQTVRFIAGTFRLGVAENTSGTPVVDVGRISNDATAADNLEAALDGTGGVTITAGLTGNVTGNLSGSVGSVTGAVGSVTGAVGSVTGDVGGNVTGSIGSLAAQAKADVNAEVDTALADINLDHLAKSAVDTDFATTVHQDSVLGHLADNGGGFDRTTDSLEAIRDRGDAAWTTGGGGSITDLLNVVPVLPASVDLADTVAWRLGLMLTNAVDDLPTTAEITPGTISIDRKAIGATSWTSIVSDSACSELAGLIYFDEVFDAGTGYAEGDSIRITFKSQMITVSANDYEISDANGRVFYAEVRQTERGTNSAYTGTPPSAATIASQVRTELATELARIDADVSTRASQTSVNTVDDLLDTEMPALTAAVAAIKAITDQMAFGTANRLNVQVYGVQAAALDAAALASDAANEIRDAVWAKGMTELTAVPAVTGTTLDALEWLFLLARNRILQTSALQTLRNDANSADIATAGVSDDGTTFVRGEWS